MHLVWLIYKRFSAYIEYISFTFILLFLWSKTSSLYPILLFSILFYSTTPIGALLSTIITNRISPKISLLISTLLQSIQLILFITYSNNVGNEALVLLGILGGLSSGIKSAAEYVFERAYEDNMSELNIQSAKTLWWELIKTFTTFVSAYYVSSQGTFGILFQIIFAITIANAFSILFLKQSYVNRKTNFKEILKLPGSNPEKALLMKAEFIDGIYEGINATIIPIALLFFVRNIFDWGLINLLLMVLSIAFGIIYIELINNQSYKPFYGLTAFIFASVSIFTIFDYNIYVLLGYMIVTTFNEVSSTIGYNTIVEKIIDLDAQKNTLLPEYKFLLEVFFGIGRIVPLLVLYLLEFDFNEEYVIKVAIVIASLLPLLTITVFGNSRLFKPLHLK